MNCIKCGKLIEDCEEWPNPKGNGTICQLCWEAYCSEEWWRLNVWQNGIAQGTEPITGGG